MESINKFINEIKTHKVENDFILTEKYKCLSYSHLNLIRTKKNINIILFDFIDKDIKPKNSKLNMFCELFYDEKLYMTELFI